MKTRAVIVDDDLFAREELKHKLTDFNHRIEVMADFEHPSEAISFIEKHRPDLLFLDIMMPEMTGFDLLEKLKQRPFEVIFTTSFDEFAIKAIRFSALDYLLKPIDSNDLRFSLDRYFSKNPEKISDEQILTLGHNFSGNPKDMRMVIPSAKGETSFFLKNIIRLEADSNYTWIHSTDHPKFISSKTLKEFDEMLTGAGFLRIHKSHLVNRQHIYRLNTSGELFTTDGTALPVSRRKLPEIKSELAT